ncbi:putative disease resistance protein RGA1 [Salvia hispanica]|uniref:putative disease resistance protein RGA1 n=1 Tax=Salvia hispanica TaxID=49212 RepID=UPI00200976AE|nr:putative disease resistance protein RGA1 [Salvia hispanica]XP_047959483.1 putative disease resistance protein RGA1 [Salvia hispanica]
MADAIVSAVVERVATIIEDKIRYEVNLVKGVKKELQKLSKKLNTIRKVLDDAEKKAVNDQSVKSWLKELENTTYEMDDILDEWNYSLLKHKLEDSAEPEHEQKIGCSFIPCSCLSFKEISFRRDIAKKIEHVNATLDQILNEKDDFNFVISMPAPESHREPTTSSIDFKNVYGSDIYKKRDDIVGNMMHNGGDTQILSIVGTGGLGKTTLAQLIFSDPQFDKDWLKIWVCVSEPFIVSKVAKDIVNSVGKETVSPDADQLDPVLQKLKASVLGKKFLLVLDDVWSEDRDKWQPLKINLEYGAPGSKILVTTRNERVAKRMGTSDDDIYHPKELNPEECWSLLRATSLEGKSEKECGKFEDVGKKIARKCKGLPLAAIVLGRLLQFKDLEGWEHVDKSEIWQLENAKVDLFPHLVLSYNDLSPTLKRCFSYCAVYPKDHRIHAETVIEEWMAQGYLGSDSGNGELELKGRENLKNLAMRCLFQDIKKNESGEQIEWCKMHDIVHDFALFLRKNDDKERSCQVCDSSLFSHVQEYRSVLWDYKPPVDERDKSFQVCNCMKSLRVLRINRCIPVGIETLIHLRWLEVRDVALSRDDLEIICRLYFLQSLILSRCKLTEIPREIENLDELRHLDLRWNKELKELSESMCKLVKLRNLFLEGCSLEVIPQEIGNLVKLRELDLSWNEEIKELPESICSLVELQILKIQHTDINCLPEALGELSNLRTLKLCPFKVGSEYNKLGFLKKLGRCLSGSLLLKIHLSSMSEMVELVEDARQKQLEIPLQKLKTLKISFKDIMNKMEQSSSSSSSSSSKWIDLVEALVPHYRLKMMAIEGYKGSRLPDFMSSPLNFIKKIHLIALSEVSSLPAMGKLPFLEILNIQGVEQLKVVGREFLGIGSSSVAFPKLSFLSFVLFSQWEEWEDITEEEDESADISIMPCLTRLSIYLCGSLKKLPNRLLRKSSSLSLLDISGSSELVKTYGEDKEGSSWRSIS